MISAGRLRFTATAKRETNLDNTGKKQKDFTTTVGSFRCDLRDTGAAEMSYAGGVSVGRTYDCLARWDALDALKVVETDRLVISGRTYNIIGIRNEGERNRLATITIEEIV